MSTEAESLLPLPPAAFHILVAMAESGRLAPMLDLARAKGLVPRKV